MKNVMMKSLILAASASTLTACGPMGSAALSGSVGSITNPVANSTSTPKITDPVAGQSASSYSMAAVAREAVMSVNSCTNCTAYPKVEDTTYTSFLGASYIDARTCMAEVVAKKVNVALQDGTVFYMTDSNSNTIRASILIVGGVTQLVTTRACNPSNQQVEAIKLDNSGSTTTAYIKQNSSIDANHLLHVYGHASGTYQNGQWSSKTWSNHTEMFDSSNNIILNKLNQFSQLGASTTVSYVGTSSIAASDNFALAGQIQVSGTSWKNYVYGNGSAIYQLQSNPAQTYSFDPNANAETINDSTGLYESAASAMTLPSLSTTIPESAFTSDDSWNCVVPAGQTVITLSQIQSAAPTETTACSAQF